MRAGQSQMIAQQVNEKRPVFNINRNRFAIDRQFDRSHGSLPGDFSLVKQNHVDQIEPRPANFVTPIFVLCLFAPISLFRQPYRAARRARESDGRWGRRK
jgi:hypothetical protein